MSFSERGSSIHEAMADQDIREDDIELAQLMARALNQFIDEGIIPRSVAEHATSDQIDEFMTRVVGRLDYDDQSSKWIPSSRFNSNEARRKIRRIFSIEHPDSERESGPGRNELIQATRKVLSNLPNNLVAGIFLYGSRMDVAGNFDPESDIDMTMVMNPGANPDLYPHKLSDQQIAWLKKQFTLTNVNSSLIESVDSIDINALLDPAKAWWGWQKGKTYFVGRDEEIAAKINDGIDSYLDSDECKDRQMRLKENVASRLKMEAGY